RRDRVRGGRRRSAPRQEAQGAPATGAVADGRLCRLTGSGATPSLRAPTGQGQQMPANPSIMALADRLRGLRGWRRRLVAFLAGGVSAMAMAPFFCWPVLWLMLPALIWLIDGAAWRAGEVQNWRWHTRPAVAAAEIGWWWGFGYFLAGLYWI